MNLKDAIMEYWATQLLSSNLQYSQTKSNECNLDEGLNFKQV